MLLRVNTVKLKTPFDKIYFILAITLSAASVQAAPTATAVKKEPVQVKQQTFKKRLLPVTKKPEQESQPVKKSKRLPGL